MNSQATATLSSILSCDKAEKGKVERKRRRGKRYANVVRFSPLHYSLAIKRNQKM
jgi:hypothetical protein